jgi:hypothetical protein
VSNPGETHIPGRPKTPGPPPALYAAQEAVSHAGPSRVGVTTTRDGDWALMVRVPQGTATPIAEVEAASGGFPVIYQYEPEEPPVARPAYPRRGE